MENKFKLLNSDLFTFGSIVIIVLGYFKLSFFYQEFYLNIFSFIDFTDLFIIFLPDAVNCGLLLFALYSLVNVNTLSKPRCDYIPPFKKSKFTINNAVKSNVILFSLLIIGYILYPALYLTIKFYSKSSFILLPFHLLFLMGVMTTRMDIILKKSHPEKTLKYLEYLAYFIVINFYLLLSANGDINKIKYGGSKITVNLEYPDKNFTINQDTVTIGQTPKYIFLYLKNEDATLILKKDNFEQIKVNRLEE